MRRKCSICEAPLNKWEDEACELCKDMLDEANKPEQPCLGGAFWKVDTQ